MPAAKLFLNTAEAAELLATSPRTLEQWRWRKLGPPYHSFGGVVRYAYTELLGWAAEQRIDPAEQRRSAGLDRE